eukprot:5273240-Pyramimonas_sp.AAC.1
MQAGPPDDPLMTPWRGAAYTATGFFDEARADLERLKEVDAKSAADADAALAKLLREEERFRRSEKRTYAGKLQ